MQEAMPPKPRRDSRLLLCALAAAALAMPADAGAALPACGGQDALVLAFDREAGAETGTLSWRVPAGPRPRSYIVHRGGVQVGETAGRSIAVEVTPGRRYVFSVRVVQPSGAPSGCESRLSLKVRFHSPSRPAGLAVTDVKGRRARLVWSPSKPGDGRVAGYRVYSKGRLYKRVRAPSLRVGVPRGKPRSFKVAAADTRGNVSRQSTAIRVLKGHVPPARPSRLKVTRATDSRVRLSWSKSRRRTGRIAGYRIYRDGLLVRQVRGRTGSDNGLLPATRYRFEVAAIDTQGYMSAPTTSVSVSTATPAPTRGRAHAFLLSTTDESFRDLQRHYDQIGTVYPTYFECRATDAAVIGRDDPLITRWSQVRGIQVLPRFDCQRPGPLHSILTNQAVRSSTMSRLVALVRQHGYDGINLDFEQGAASDRDALTSFVSDLAGRLHAIGKRLAVEVSAKYEHTTTGRSGFYDYAALGRAADRVFVMNWGWHWTTSAPGAPDDLELCRRVADYVASMPNRARFVLGTHLYGMDWPNGGGPSNPATALEYEDVRALMARHGARPVLDPAADAWVFTYEEAGVHHEVWYPDAATIGRRIRLARDRGLGIGFWRLGREDQAIWRDAQIAPNSVWP
jgi:spore germination protein YaaH